MPDLTVDFFLLKTLNKLSKHKRGDLINAFFDEKSALFGIHAVVAKLYNVDRDGANKMIGGKTTKDVSDLIIKKLEETATSP